jgi:hypothetical protein
MLKCSGEKDFNRMFAGRSAGEFGFIGIFAHAFSRNPHACPDGDSTCRNATDT